MRWRRVLGLRVLTASRAWTTESNGASDAKKPGVAGRARGDAADAARLWQGA